MLPANPLARSARSGSAAARCVLVCFLLFFSGSIVSAQQSVIVESERFKQLGVLRPHETFMLYFQVPSSFVGDGMTLDAKYKADGWNTSSATLHRLNSTHLGFAQPVIVAAETGHHSLVWTSLSATANLSWTVEVSCTDGDVCNGQERLVWVNGRKKKCVSTKKPLCDDGLACTEDTCNNGVCSYQIRNSSLARRTCAKCQGKKCKRNCKDKVCGPDGCGGQCGPVCTGEDTYCIRGKCVQKDIDGTCKTPIDITPQAANLSWNGEFVVMGNTKKGVNTIIPKCNTGSMATEIIYLITVPQNLGFIGLDARVHGTGKRKDGSWDTDSLDTVIQIIEADPDKFPNPADGCLSANTDPSVVVSCSDDATPPGSYASRATWMLKPGYSYYIHVDGYSAVDVGPFVLEMRLSPQCTLQCSGVVCGPSNCPGFSCGTCPNNLECSADGRACIKKNCKPKCKKSRKKCGPDSCGNSCGTCDASKSEFCLDGECTRFPKCNPLLPKCTHKVGRGRLIATRSGCPPGRYCSTDCKCRDVDAALPDLVIAEEKVIPEIVEEYDVEPSSCALAEGCLGGTGKRRIIKFATDIFNQGTAHFDPPNPPESRPDLFEWANCHGHYHFQNFAKFELLNSKNEVIVEGQKRSYCAMDSTPYFAEHPRMPCVAQTSCSEQGVSIGWLGKDIRCGFTVA